MKYPSSDPHWEYLLSAEWTYNSDAQLVHNVFNRVITDVGLTDPSAKPLTDRDGLLIAAAPDLLAAIRDVLCLLEENAPGLYDDYKAITMAQLAIDKAVGKPTSPPDSE